MSISARTPLVTHPASPESETTAPIDVKARSVALTTVAFAAAMGLLYWAREVFIPIVLSVLVSYALEPVVVWLMRLRIPRVAASALVVAIFVGLIFWSFVWGLWGPLLTVPMLVAVKACCDRIDDLKPIAELLGE